MLRSHRNILSGAEKGAKRDVVILNTALCLAAALGKEISEGIRMAAEMIDSGKALEKLEAFICATNEVEE